MKKLVVFLFIFVFLFLASGVLAHLPRIIYTQSGSINIINPETSQAFYDELKGTSREYFIDSDKGWELYINILVPGGENGEGKYSVVVYVDEQQIALVDGYNFVWKEYFEPFGRDWYMKGPEFVEQVPAGKYKIEVYSADLPAQAGNLGKYVLAVGQKESFNIQSVVNVYWQLPFLKLTFFKTSVLQFFLTPFGIGLVGLIGGLLILLALINYLIGLVKEIIKHNEAKTLLLTSGGMLQMQDEIIKLLQKPAYDVTVGFINTAYKYKLEEDFNYQNIDLQIMKDIGFNVEEIDIEGKSQRQVMNLLELKDIIFVAGGNTFYLLKAMRACNFEKVVRKLLKNGTVYVGVSAGTIVAGNTIKTAGWKDADKNIVKLKNLKGLGLVPFDIFVHYAPEWVDTIKKEMPDCKKRVKKLRIITDDQGILVQGKEVHLIGDGEAVIV